MALISDEYFELAKVSCKGEYLNPDPSNAQCNYALRLINECIENIHKPHVLEPECESVASVPNDFGRGKQLLEYDSINLLPSEQDGPRCRDHIYALSGIWANDPTVQDALHTRKGTIAEWTKCNDSISHKYSAESVVPYHKLLSKKRGRALVYSGDHDMIVPYTATLQWIRDLNLTVEEDWRPWIFNGQVAGYTKKYKNNEFDLTFATVKGAGHLPPEYNPKECFAMVDRWLSLYPL
ncbi:Serine carboxypeptidase-like 17 [Abeliophyllum distichum]|uniref:Serine carboxypeptidase-like 17 n=1 Tax=Abeliophyllum distichum TaxID=126358 RepID=A0ABD1RS77_9LAMI